MAQKPAYEELEQRVKILEKENINLKQEERARSRHEAELHATLYGIGDAIITTDIKGRVRRVNPVAEQLMGWREAEVAGKSLEDFFFILDEKTRCQVESPAVRVLNGGVSVELNNHTLLITRGGKELPITGSGSPILDSRRHVTGMVLAFCSQTEEHLTQRFIEIRYSLIEYAANHSLDELLIKALDEVGDLLDSPIGFYHFVGHDQKTLSLQQWSTRTLKEFCKAEGRGTHYGIEQAGVWVDCVYERKPVIHNDYASLPHKKGMPEGHAEVTREMVVPVMREDKIVAILGVGNKPTDYTKKDMEIVSYLADVTWEIVRQKGVEEALRSEKMLSEEYINSLPGLFYVFDEQRLVRWNGAMNRITGYSDEELASMYGTDFFEGKDKMLIKEQMLKVFREGTAEAEAELVTKSGQRIPYYFNGLRKKLNGKDHLIGLGIDITDRKRAEEEKRKALEFAAEQSKHALIGQVAGKMAHDFNNVLMGIMGNAQLAIMNCDDEKIRTKLERINEFSERGRNITSNLISFSKDQEPKQTCFKIEDKIELVLKMLEKDLAGIQVSRNYKPGIPKLLADPGMIQDALVNLVQNSIHAMSKVESPTLKLKAYSKDGRIYFEIEDNGCGIPKEYLDSIYTPSFTLKGSHDKTGSYKSGIKGTGYGMSNVKKYIVEKHKGDISLESEVGKGTRITIALRIIKNQLSSDEKKELVKNKIYDKRKILLVEDEPAIADVQYQILTQEPFSHIVSIAANGQTAIDIFDRNEFDVVSLDYMLPGNINGLDVYNHIREKDKDIPVMFISGNIGFIESIKQLKEKDPNLEHLSKPVDNMDYVNKVNELIGNSIQLTTFSR